MTSYWDAHLEHEKEILRAAVERTDDGRGWVWTCPICGERHEHPTAILAHRALRAHYSTCRPVGL